MRVIDISFHSLQIKNERNGREVGNNVTNRNIKFYIPRYGDHYRYNGAIESPIQSPIKRHNKLTYNFKYIGLQLISCHTSRTEVK
jgi:hypothetical protein